MAVGDARPARPFYKHLVTSKHTGQTHKLRVNATCKSSDVVYVIECKKCGLQYVGGTEQRLSDRMNSHRSDIRLKKTLEKPVDAHFCSANHSMDDLRVLVV